MVRAMSRICSQMSWSPRPLSSSLGGRFLGGSGAAGLLLHHPLIVPNRCVMRHLRVRIGDGLGDLAPIGRKAESCGFGQVLYVCYCPEPPCPSRRLLGDVDAERKEITAPRHLIVSFREEPFTVTPAFALIWCTTMSVPKTLREGSSSNGTVCDSRSPRGCHRHHHDDK
jgi:hypothetical protein